MHRFWALMDIMHYSHFNCTTCWQFLCKPLLTQIERYHSATNYIIIYVHISRAQGEIWSFSVVFFFHLVWMITPSEPLQTSSTFRYVTIRVWCRAKCMWMSIPWCWSSSTTGLQHDGLPQAVPGSSETNGHNPLAMGSVVNMLRRYPPPLVESNAHFVRRSCMNNCSPKLQDVTVISTILSSGYISWGCRVK